MIISERQQTPLSNTGVAALGVLEIFFGLQDDVLVGPTIGAKGVTVKTLRLLLVILAGDGLKVQRDDRNLKPAIGVAAVGREGEDSDLIFSLRRGGRIRLDLIRVGLVQLSDAQVAHTYSNLIRTGSGVVAESIQENSRAAWTTEHSLAELNALGKGLGDAIYSGD